MKSLILFVCLLLFNYCANSAPVIQTPSNQIIWSDFLGINVQFEWWNETIINKQISILKELNIEWIRASIHWYYLEPEQDNIQWSLYDTAMNLIKGNNFKTIITFVGTPNWASSYTSGTPSTDTYPPKDDSIYADRILKINSKYSFINYLEIWNEQNLAGLQGFWAPYYNATRYNQLYQTTATIVRDAGYGSKLAVGGLGYYGLSIDKDGNQVNMVDDLLELNTFENSLVTYHPYTDIPEGGKYDPADSIYGHLYTSQYINSKIRNGKANGVWTTEWGWSSTDQVDQDTQARYTIRRLLLDTLVGFNKTFLFTISDLDARASSLRDQGYGIMSIAGEKKPIFNALAFLFNITGSTISSDSSFISLNYLEYSQLGEDFVGIFYKKESTNTTLFAFWSISNHIPFQLNVNQTGLLYSFNNLSSILIKPTIEGSISLKLSLDVQIFEWPIINNSDSKSSESSSNSSESSESSSKSSESSSSDLSNSTQLNSNLLFNLIYIISIIILIN